MICGVSDADGPARVLARLLGCCYASVEDGPASCTCWEVVFDSDQVVVETPVALGDIEPWPDMCGDCAYRPDSPERNGDERYDHGELLDELPDGEVPFWCHRGMRKVKEWRHPLGIVIAADGDYYVPVQADGVPYQTDGSPARQCAGWAARRKARHGS